VNWRATDVVNAGFRLAGLAGKSPEAFERLIDAFDADASIIDDGDLVATNAEEVRAYLRDYFTQRVGLYYVWNVREEHGLEVTVDWAITGSHPAGGVLTFSGIDTIVLTDAAKVAQLRIARH
jgi:hypothetical protein